MSWKDIDQKLTSLGRELSKLFISLIGIIMLLGIPIAGIAAAIYAGAALASLVGGGAFAVILFFCGSFAILLFLSVYVWTPHVWPALKRATDALTDSN